MFAFSLCDCPSAPKCIMTASAPHHFQRPGCASISPSGTALRTHGWPPSTPSKPLRWSSMPWPERPASANSQVPFLPQGLPSLIRAFPEPSPALPRQRPRSLPCLQDLSWPSGPATSPGTTSSLSARRPLHAQPLPGEHLPLDLPPTLQPLLLILREAIPGPWPKSAL